jgi:hypothetical protein
MEILNGGKDQAIFSFGHYLPQHRLDLMVALADTDEANILKDNPNQ